MRLTTTVLWAWVGLAAATVAHQGHKLGTDFHITKLLKHWTTPNSPKYLKRSSDLSQVAFDNLSRQGSPESQQNLAIKQSRFKCMIHQILLVLHFSYKKPQYLVCIQRNKQAARYFRLQHTDQLFANQTSHTTPVSKYRTITLMMGPLTYIVYKRHIRKQASFYYLVPQRCELLFG